MINKRQARDSFNVSLAAIVVGFAAIIAGIAPVYVHATPDLRLTAIAGLSDVLLEFIGGAYFFMYRRSLEQVNLFFTQLTKMQDTMLAIELAADLPDQQQRGVVLERVVAALLERSLTPPSGSVLTADAAGLSGGVDQPQARIGQVDGTW